MARFRVFPKTPSGSIDKEKVKEQYLSGVDYIWSKFCEKHNYNFDLRQEFPIASWQGEWIIRKSELRAELFTASALELQSEVLQQRVAVLRGQDAANHRIRQQFNRTVAAAEASAVPMSPRELQQLVGAQRVLQQCEFEALLMTAHSSKEPLELDSPHIRTDGDRELERLRNIPYELMGGESLTEDKMMEIMEKWVDQSESNFRRHAELISPMDLPLDSLDGD